MLSAEVTPPKSPLLQLSASPYGGKELWVSPCLKKKQTMCEALRLANIFTSSVHTTIKTRLRKGAILFSDQSLKKKKDKKKTTFFSS